MIEEPVEILRLPEVLSLIKLSRSTLYAMLARGDFPRPVKLSIRARAWRRSEVEKWLRERTR